MKKYIALLRGINVGGHKKIKMVDLKAMMEKSGFKGVQTYIQSGNIVFKSEAEKLQNLEMRIKNSIENTFGFDVPVVVKTRTEMVKILKDNPFTKKEDLEANKIYYVLLQSEPEHDAIVNIDPEKYPNETFLIHTNCVYLNCKNGAGKAKLTTNVIERKLKVSATTRNHKTILKLLEISL